ncbi:MAG: hypothetical protein ACHQFZ_09030 [Acidimicrobiales bacterium]
MSEEDRIVGRGTPRGSAGLERAIGSVEVSLARSEARFPDGAQLRVEIPSVENPAALRAVLAEADALGLVVHRVSQGSGAMLLSEAELREMVLMGADRGLEVNLFIGPREEFGVGGTVHASDGRALSGHLRGLHQLRYALEDVTRAVERGIRGFLVADVGFLEILVTLVRAGELPGELVFKASAVLAPSNPVSFKQLAELGATTINVPSDLSLLELAEMRAFAPTPIDLYLEAPDALGGMVRGHEVTEMVLVAAPLYAKYGLRNARAVYPAGYHLMSDVVENVREKVRRAAISMEWLRRSDEKVAVSEPGAAGIGVPVP